MKSRIPDYLASLERRPYVSNLRLVRQAIEDAGIPPEDWLLDIHSRYAGYVEPIGLNEHTVYGVYHETWCVNGGNGVFADNTPGDWSIACADAHESYDFNLYHDGTFLGSGCGGPSVSFHAKLEKDALHHLFRSGHRIRYALAPTADAMLHFAQKLADHVSPEPEFVASDAFDTFYLADCLLICIPKEGIPTVFVRGDRAQSVLRNFDCTVQDSWVRTAT